MEEVFVQVRFKETTKYGEYQDCLYYDIDEYNALAKSGAISDDVAAKKKERVNTWVDAIENTPPAQELTKEQLQDQKSMLEVQIMELDLQINNEK